MRREDDMVRLGPAHRGRCSARRAVRGVLQRTPTRPAGYFNAQRTGYFKTLASRFPTFAPPDFVTNDVRTGIALLTISGLSPSFVNADAAPASPPVDPPNCDNAPVALPRPPLGAGAAPRRESMPGTAFAI